MLRALSQRAARTSSVTRATSPLRPKSPVAHFYLPINPPGCAVKTKMKRWTVTSSWTFQNGQPDILQSQSLLPLDPFEALLNFCISYRRSVWLSRFSSPDLGDCDQRVGSVIALWLARTDNHGAPPKSVDSQQPRGASDGHHNIFSGFCCVCSCREAGVFASIGGSESGILNLEPHVHYSERFPYIELAEISLSTRVRSCFETTNRFEWMCA